MHVEERYAERILPASTLGLAATLSLLYLMHMLIASDPLPEVTAPPAFPIEFLPNIDDPPPPIPERLIRPPKVEPTPSTSMPSKADPMGTFIDVTQTPSLDRVARVTQMRLADRDVIPLYRPTPQYPDRARRLGLEGWVLVEVDVAETGAVSAARVIDSEPAEVFDRAARTAALKSRYRPKVVDGKAVPQIGIRARITFKLEQ